MRKANLPMDAALKIHADNTEEDSYRAVQELLNRDASFDGLFAVTDVLAIGAMRAIVDAGRRVPWDVSVVGFDDLPLAASVNPPLTTVQQNIREAGEGMVKSIVRLIEGEPVESVKLQPKLIVRRSCGAKT
jgi:DNA-binding LacI/PurR family transcriptional regulator